MPELPEVEALADHLRRHAVGTVIGRVDIAALSVLKTFDPPVTALHGAEVTGAARWGKYLGLQAGELYLITHLSRAGWLRWSDKLAPTPLKPGKGPIALRVHLGDGHGFDLTEAGTQKRLAVWVVRNPMDVPQIAGLGPDALELDVDGLHQALAGEGDEGAFVRFQALSREAVVIERRAREARTEESTAKDDADGLIA